MVAKRDIEIVRGDDYSHLITFVNEDETPLDLTGYTGQAQIRKTPADTDAPEATFTVTIATPLTGEVLVELDAVQSADLPAVKKHYYWDLELTTDTGQIVTPLGGKVIVIQDVTHI